MQIDQTLRIEAPPEAVFAGLEAVSDWPRWMPGLVAIEHTTPLPIKVGSRWIETRQVLGRTMTETFEVSDLEHPTRIHCVVGKKPGSRGKGRYQFRYHLQRDGLHTQLRFRAETLTKGPGALLMLGAKGLIKQALMDNLRALKAYVEAEHQANG